MLLVGPSPVFLRYIDEVLPSLGEDEVQLSTITTLKPRHQVSSTEPASVAMTKGDARMAQVIARALRDRQHPLREDLHLTFEGFHLTLSRRATMRILERARARRGTHNERRPGVVTAVLEHLEHRYRRMLLREYEQGAGGAIPDPDEVPVAAMLARGEEPPREWKTELRARLRAVPELRAALDRMWPVLSGAELIHDLFGFAALICSASRGILDPSEQAQLLRPRSVPVAEAAWTHADLALIDEADALLGPPSAARRRKRRSRGPSSEELRVARRTLESTGAAGFLTAGALLERYGGDGAEEDDEDGEIRTFGHVLVDEAQDLSAMEWRMLARRGPSGSMTLVGDPGQASRPGALADWDAIGRIVGRTPRQVHLSVNYRTPREIMDLAERVLAAAAPDVPAPRSVRSSGVEPRFVRDDDVMGRTRTEVERSSHAGGTLAVIAPEPSHEDLLEALAPWGAAKGSEAIDAPVAVLAPTQAKGLEFDHIVVVEPAALVSPDAAGLRLLYVTLTRATRTLTIVHRSALPEALLPV